ncbi:MAG: glycine cleavage system aminomethyltransferase GcvT [Verrucomicrobiota bacterium]|jgi:aminomethyltransferase
MLKRTPLFAAHQRLGARLVEFGGWEMPVQYSSIVDEHLAVRRAGGLFDIAHMGEVTVDGPGALAFLNHLLTNDAARLTPGQGQYTLMCNERGGVIDDLYAYRLADQQFLLVINASRIEPDVAWMRQQLAAWPQRDQVRLEDRSDALAAVALQGPRVRGLIDTVFPGPFTGGAKVAKASELKKNEIVVTTHAGQPAWIGCTGYTGEDGFEIIAPNAVIEAIWDHLLRAGHAHCLQPAGLGARDTLRTEVCYPLYGHELDENTTPIEAGVGFFVALDKGEFNGRAVLAAQKANGTARRCVAFKMTDKSAPPRPHYPIWSTGPAAAKVGEVTSGTQSPSLNAGIGLGYVPADLAKPGTPIEIEIRGRRSPAVIVAKPIYKK